MASKLNFILAATNFIGIFPLLKIIQLDPRPVPILVVSSAIISSIFMHLSESKHNLVAPTFFRKNSTLFLNFDRISAVTAILYFFPKWLHAGPWMDLFNLSIGLVFSAIGENTDNLWIYGITHTLWHYFAYVTMYNTI